MPSPLAKGPLPISQGTSFPAGRLNRRFFRTDLSLDCYYDGTRWLTVNEYAVSMSPRDALQPTNSLWMAADTTQAGMYLLRLLLHTQVQTTNNASNYRTFQLISTNNANTDSNVGTAVNSSADTVFTPAIHNLTLNIVSAATQTRFRVDVGIGAGGPGASYVHATLVYKLIVT